MDTLLNYINSLSPADQSCFADRCNTSVGYLRKAISIKQTIREALCIDIERESKGAVRCEEMRPDVDWAYIRSTKQKAA